MLNAGTTPIDLNGYQIAAGISYTFGNQTLPAGQRIVVVKNVAAFQSRYGNTALANGTFSGSLNNGGEELTLLGTFGETVQRFTYDNSNGWPGRANGKGSTLEIIDPLGDESDPNNWRNSSEYNGSPVAAGTGKINGIVINEILTHTDPPLTDAVEFYNSTTTSIDVGGWFISDNNDNYQKFRIPTGTVIPAGGYLLFDEDDFNPTPANPGPKDFSFNSAHGDDVWLLSADPVTGKLLNFVDHVDFGAAANGESFGRWPSGSGKLYPMQSRTLGAANSGPRIGPVAISEIMYNPPSANDDLEYVELLNLTNAPIDLTGWKFTSGIDFTFTGTTLPAGGKALVLRFDPSNPGNAAKLSAFQAAYPNIPQGTILAGGYAGALDGGVLDNGGETLRLSRPDEPPADEPAFIPYLLVDEVEYDDVAPWPTSPDGTGHSLTRVSTLVYGEDPANWIGTVPSPGVATITQPLSTITGTSGPDTYYVIRSGSQLWIYENTAAGRPANVYQPRLRCWDRA